MQIRDLCRDPLAYVRLQLSSRNPTKCRERSSVLAESGDGSDHTLMHLNRARGVYLVDEFRWLRSDS
jgi:hypothetical protein